MRTTILHHVPFLLLIILVSSCNKSADPILSNDCTQSCWNNIILGKSTSDDVNNALETLSQIDHLTINQFSATQFVFPDGIEWSFTNGIKGVVYFKNDIAVELDFEKTDYYLDQLIGKYGEPNYFILAPYWGNKISIYLIYSEKSIILRYEKRIKANNIVSIEPKDRVTTIIYIFPDVQKFLLEEITYNSRKFYGTNIDDLIHTWNGYGQIQYR